MSHTPGPWTVRNGYPVTIMSQPNARREIYVATIMQRANEDENDANARLIAVAPLLLAACEAVLLFLTRGRGTCDYCEGPLRRSVPYNEGEHDMGCPVPVVLDAVKQARSA